MKSFALRCTAVFIGLVPALTAATADHGAFELDMRLRYERTDTEQPGETPATALTWRVAPGWRSPVWHDLTLRVGLQATAVLVDDYSDLENRNGSFAVIEDPAFIDLDDTSLTWQPFPAFAVSVGREAASLGDHRFISAQPWRQKRQNLDGGHVRYRDHGIAFDYLYTAAADDPSDRRTLQRTHTTQGGWGLPRWGRATVIAQRYDRYHDPDANVDSLALRLGNDATDWDALGPIYTIEAGTQRPGPDATWQGRRSELLTQAGVAYQRWNTFTLGFERIGADDAGLGFDFPLSYDRIVSSSYRDLSAKLSLWGLVPFLGAEAQYHVYQQLADGETFAKEAKLDVVHYLDWSVPLRGAYVEAQIRRIDSPASFLAEQGFLFAVGYRRSW